MNTSHPTVEVDCSKERIIILKPGKPINLILTNTEDSILDTVYISVDILNKVTLPNSVKRFKLDAVGDITLPTKINNVLWSVRSANNTLLEYVEVDDLLILDEDELLDFDVDLVNTQVKHLTVLSRSLYIKDLPKDIVSLNFTPNKAPLLNLSPFKKLRELTLQDSQVQVLDLLETQIDRVSFKHGTFPKTILGNQFIHTISILGSEVDLSKLNKLPKTLERLYLDTDKAFNKISKSLPKHLRFLNGIKV